MRHDDFNAMLTQIGAGQSASTALMDRLYSELRSMANTLMRSERRGHTLQPTALVHEAFLRLVDAEAVGVAGHLRFLELAARTMRRVLVDHARRARAQKRGGDGEKLDHIALDGFDDDGETGTVDFVALHEVLSRLEYLDPRQAKIVELRFFGGMTGQQIAEHLGISRSTVVREISLSRAWLRRELRRLAD